MKLLVRNLSRITTEDALIGVFKPFGNVQFCKLVMDKSSGESKGFGFVEMPSPGDAKAAMKNLNGVELDGMKIRVKKAEDNSVEKASESKEANPDVAEEISQ